MASSEYSKQRGEYSPRSFARRSSRYDIEADLPPSSNTDLYAIDEELVYLPPRPKNSMIRSELRSRPTNNSTIYKRITPKPSTYRQDILKPLVSYPQNSYKASLLFFLGVLGGMALVLVGPVSIQWIFSLVPNVINAFKQQDITNILQNVASIITIFSLFVSICLFIRKRT